MSNFPDVQIWPDARHSCAKSLRSQIGTITHDPLRNEHTEIGRQQVHLIRLDLGNGIGSLVIADIPLLAEKIELLNLSGVEPDGELERMDHAIVVIVSLGCVARRRQRGGRKLQGCVVCNVEAPVRYQMWRFAGLKIAIGEAE